MPTKALRVMKVIRKRNSAIHTQVLFGIPKKRCASRKTTPSSRKRLTKSVFDQTTPQKSDSENIICNNTSIFESKDTEITQHHKKRVKSGLKNLVRNVQLLTLVRFI